MAYEWRAAGSRAARGYWRSWLVMLGLLSCQAAGALSPDVTIGDLGRTTWEARDGAPSAVVALAQTSDELAQGRPVIFHSIVEGSWRRLQPVVKDEAFCLGREALLNAFRHSQAASIEVQIVYATDCLRLRIRDDGTGVDARSLDIRSHPDHWGVQGMRERAKRIGAQFDLWSRPESGTEIELTVPAAVASSGRARRSSPFMRWQRRSEAPPPAPS